MRPQLYRARRDGPRPDVPLRIAATGNFCRCRRDDWRWDGVYRRRSVNDGQAACSSARAVRRRSAREDARVTTRLHTETGTSSAFDPRNAASRSVQPPISRLGAGTEASAPRAPRVEHCTCSPGCPVRPMTAHGKSEGKPCCSHSAASRPRSRPGIETTLVDASMAGRTERLCASA